MKRFNVYVTIYLSGLFSACNNSNSNYKMADNAPKAKKIDTVLSFHGVDRTDPYFWMNKRGSKGVLAYINEENVYSKSFFKENSPLTDKIMGEFEKNTDPNQEYPPTTINGITYQGFEKEGLEYPIYYTVSKLKKVFIDENKYAENSPFYALSTFESSPNNQLLAIVEDVMGRNNWRIRFRNHGNETFLKDKIENTAGSVVWANDNQTVFYVKKDTVTLRENRVFKHVLGTSTKSDVLVYEEKDEQFGVYISKSSSNKYIYISSQSSTQSETRMLLADALNNDMTLFMKRKKDHIYELLHHTSGWVLLTNDKALNNRVLFSKTLELDLNKWQELIAHEAINIIESLTLTKDFVVSQERKNGLDQIRYTSLLNLKNQEFISFENNCYSAAIMEKSDLNDNKMRYWFNSLHIPPKIYELNLQSKTLKTIYECKVPNPEFSVSNYTSKRIEIIASDGTKIPVSLVYKNDTDLKKAPLLEYGYGAYGVSESAYFSASRLSLLDRGFIFAVAHIRGGRDMGEAWYQNGKFLNKKNTFTDFIDVAKALPKLGYGDPKKQYALGGSAGGLLMGAVANMAPKQWKGIIAEVPFVDVVTTMLDASIPLTTGEYEEWGNPNDKTYFDYMLSYSPYDNVHKTDYPHMLVNTGYHDSQVQYWEPLKWIAKLRSLKTDENLLLFQCNMDAGHGGGSGRTSVRRETAKNFTFLLTLENIRD